ncbi:uncharacterized protein LOC111259936 isoform X2 [Varroa jacobsoni]|nr:uncharacterized protein LOC111259936 isoform X2 [Varroa jacobsoni]XP_022688082.1 uncharacterized protein LOC111259936 isoform X2 [Varroa jacobsoni]
MAHPCSGVVRKLLSVLRAAPKQLVSAHDTKHLQPPPALPFTFRNEYKINAFSKPLGTGVEKSSDLSPAPEYNDMSHILAIMHLYGASWYRRQFLRRLQRKRLNEVPRLFIGCKKGRLKRRRLANKRQEDILAAPGNPIEPGWEMRVCRPPTLLLGYRNASLKRVLTTNPRRGSPAWLVHLADPLRSLTRPNPCLLWLVPVPHTRRFPIAPALSS